MISTGNVSRRNTSCPYVIERNINRVIHWWAYDLGEDFQYSLVGVVSDIVSEPKVLTAPRVRPGGGFLCSLVGVRRGGGFFAETHKFEKTWVS